MKRITVKIEHKKKIFFEKLLNTMKTDQEDRKMKYVLFKALENLKKCPFEMNSIVDLKNVQGIGDNIAVKCDESWKNACKENDGELTLKQVKKLSSDDFRRFINGAKSTSEKLKDARRQERIEGGKNSEKSSKKTGEDEFMDSDEEGENVPSTSAPITKTNSFPPQPPPPKPPVAPSLIRSTSSTISTGSSTDSSSDSLSFRILTCRPIDQPRVILIADNREHRANPRYKSVIEHLVKKNDITVDIRGLSVGDYIWICKKIDGSEIVMDWVVERKTWDDLQSSIRGGRYDEQKARLGMAPMKNRIYLIEANSKGDVACEQAVSSTLSNGGYLIQRCSDTRDTAAFLREVTIMLQNKAACDEISGVPFSQLQNLLQKKKAETVKEVWIRQLMVCPGMSHSRAEAIADKFPSMPALLSFFRVNGDDSPIQMLNIMPQITRPITRNLYKFFVK